MLEHTPLTSIICALVVLVETVCLQKLSQCQIILKDAHQRLPEVFLNVCFLQHLKEGPARSMYLPHKLL